MLPVAEGKVDLVARQPNRSTTQRALQHRDGHRRAPLSGEPDGVSGVFGATDWLLGCARGHPEMDRSLARERSP